MAHSDRVPLRLLIRPANAEPWLEDMDVNADAHGTSVRNAASTELVVKPFWHGAGHVARLLTLRPRTYTPASSA